MNLTDLFFLGGLVVLALVIGLDISKKNRIKKTKPNKCKVISKGQQTTIPVSVVEFYNGGNTMWIHSTEGATTMRIKCTGRINVEQCKDSPVSHCDILISGNINFCISNDAE